MASAKLIRTASNRRARIQADNQETEDTPLLGGGEGNRPQSSGWESGSGPPASSHFHPYQFSDLPIYDNIWRIRKDITDAVKDPYSLEQIRSPRLTNGVVRPLLDEYYALSDISIVFCLLVNREHFLRSTSVPHHNQSVNVTRALFCEVVASRLLRQFDDNSVGPHGLLLLANIVISGFDPFQLCPQAIERVTKSSRWALQEHPGYERQMTALEVGILSESKIFLSSPACQKVIDAVYTGRIVYTPTSFMDILPDHYKHMPISIYDPRKENLLNQYRLAVPRIRTVTEVIQFLILLALYFWVMTTKQPDVFPFQELVFCVYSFGWILDQFASILEHGWEVYSQNLWSFLDVTFSLIFIIYFGLRMHGLRTDKLHISQPALDLLAMAAPFLIPRLAFNIFSENMVFVSLRDMMAKFVLLMVLAVWSFAGFFLSMFWLSKQEIPATSIGKWMVWVWFGLDGTGITRSVDFHWLLGPILMIAFAVLGNTLFLTILVSTLSSSFSKISAHSMAEVQFRRAVLTFLGVKSDAIFAYPPPFNIVALFVMLPLKLVLSPRWFHKINITVVRIINLPVLLLVGLYERYTLWPGGYAATLNQKSSRQSKSNGLRWFRVHSDIDAVFEAPPPHMVETETDNDDFLNFVLPGEAGGRQRVERAQSTSLSRSRSGGCYRARRGSGSNPEHKTVERRLSRIEEMLVQMNDNEESE